MVYTRTRVHVHNDKHTHFSTIKCEFLCKSARLIIFLSHEEFLAFKRMLMYHFLLAKWIR